MNHVQLYCLVKKKPVTVKMLIFFHEQFGLRAESVGLLMVAVSLPYGAASPILGIMSDKYPVSQFSLLKKFKRLLRLVKVLC